MDYRKASLNDVRSVAVLFQDLTYHIKNSSKDVYWDFDTVKEKLYRKLKVIAFVKAHTKFINKIE